jgi:hypothetical protein
LVEEFFGGIGFVPSTGKVLSDLWQAEICGCVDTELVWSQETHYCGGKLVQFVSLEYPTSALVCNQTKGAIKVTVQRIKFHEYHIYEVKQQINKVYNLNKSIVDYNSK